VNLLRNWRAYLPKGERLYLLLGGLFIALLALALFVYVALALVPNVRIRGELIGVVATAEQALQAEVAAQAAAPATLQAQIATAQAQVDEAAAAFLSETQAVEALDRLYQYARESGVTIVELQAQPAPEPEAVEGVSSLIAFGLRMTGEAPRLMNFLARLRETALSGFVITNVNIAEEEDESVASMNVALYTSPYAAGAIAQTITGFVTLPVLPRLTLAFPTPGVLTPMLTQTVLALTTPTVVNPTATSASLVVAPTAPLAPAPVPTAGCINLLNNGDFELEGSWLFGQALTPAQVTTAQHHGGARAMQLGNPPTAGMLNRNSYSSVRQLVTIPATATVVTLRWWHLYGSGEPVAGDPGTVGDRQEVLLLTPAEQPFAVIQRARRNDSGWQQAAVDLTAYRGQSFYVYFNVFNDGGGTPTWMYLDDVQLESCTGAIPAPTTTSAPFVTATNTPIVIAPATNTPTTPPTTAATPTTPPTATALPPAAGCTNLVVNGDFETDGGWLLGQAMIPPQFTTDQRHSGARAVQLGSPPAAGASTRGSYSSIRQLVTIPANAGGVTLRWWHLYGTAEAATTDPGTTSDRQEVLLLTPDEKVLAVVQRVRRNDSGWQQETADLTAYRGRSVYLYFNVYNNGNGAATWAYVDDVQLETCSGLTPVPATATPLPNTATSTPTLIPSFTPTTPADLNQGIQFGEPVVFDSSGFKTVGVIATNTTNLVKSFTAKITYKNGDQILATAEGIVYDLLPNQSRAMLLFPRNDIPLIYDTARIDVDLIIREAETTEGAEVARKISFGLPSLIDNAGSVTLYVEVKSNDNSTNHSFNVQAVFTQAGKLMGIGSGTVNDLAPGQIKTASLFIRGTATDTDIQLAVDMVFE